MLKADLSSALAFAQRSTGKLTVPLRGIKLRVAFRRKGIACHLYLKLA